MLITTAIYRGVNTDTISSGSSNPAFQNPFPPWIGGRGFSPLALLSPKGDFSTKSGWLMSERHYVTIVVPVGKKGSRAWGTVPELPQACRVEDFVGVRVETLKTAGKGKITEQTKRQGCCFEPDWQVPALVLFLEERKE